LAPSISTMTRFLSLAIKVSQGRSRKRRLPVSDEITGLDTAKTLLRITYEAMSETDEVDRATPLTRAREIALSLIDSVIGKEGTPLPSPQHFPPHSWRATVGRNLRLEKPNQAHVSSVNCRTLDRKTLTQTVPIFQVMMCVQLIGGHRHGVRGY
jgi:hypothetical protein